MAKNKDNFKKSDKNLHNISFDNFVEYNIFVSIIISFMKL